MFVDTAVETLDAGEEEGEGNGGKTNWHNNDSEDRGEEEGSNCDNTCRQMIPKSIVAGVNNSR